MELTIFTIFHTTFAFMGCFLNLLLMYLAIFKTTKAMRIYSTLIINFCITEFFACLLDGFVEQRIIPGGKSLFYISYGYCTLFGPSTCYVAYSLMLHCLAHSLWSLLVSFSYRFLILKKINPSRTTIVLALLVIYIPSTIQWISFIWAKDDEQEVRRELHTKFPEYELDGQTVTGTIDIVSFSALFTILHMILPITPVYMCILFLRNRIVKTLESNAQFMRSDTKNMHKQLLTALTYQAMIPMIFLFSVVSYVIGQSGLYNHPLLEYFTFSGFVVIPVLSPLCSLYYIGPYRKAVSVMLHGPRVSTTTHTKVKSTEINVTDLIV